MAIDASIPLSIQPAKIPSAQERLNLMSLAQQIKMQQAQLAGQNAIKQMSANPDYFDQKIGVWTPKGVQAITQVGGMEMGLKAEQNRSTTLARVASERSQEAKTAQNRMKAASTQLNSLQEQLIKDYEGASAAGAPESEAWRQASEKYQDAIREIERSGMGQQLGWDEAHINRLLTTQPKNINEARVQQARIKDLLAVTSMLDDTGKPAQQATGQGPGLPSPGAPSPQSPGLPGPHPDQATKTMPLSGIGKPDEVTGREMPAYTDQDTGAQVQGVDDPTPQGKYLAEGEEPPVEGKPEEMPGSAQAKDEVDEQTVKGSRPIKTADDYARMAQAARDKAKRMARVGNADGYKQAQAEAKHLDDMRLKKEKEVIGLERDQQKKEIDEKKIEIAMARLGHSAERLKASTQPLPDDAAKLLVQMYLGGNTVALQGWARNQVVKNQLSTMMAQEARKMGMSPGDINAKIAEFRGIEAGERSLGQRTANIGTAVAEADKFAGLVTDASKKVPRTKYSNVNQVINAWKTRTGDPGIVEFGAALNSFLNAYARAVGGGVMHVSDREHAEQMLNKAMSQGQIEAGIKQLQREMVAAKEAPGEVRGEFREAITGKQPAQDMTGKPGKVIKWGDLK